MAVQDKVITLQGSQAVVRKVEIMLDGKGNYAVAAYGETTAVGGQKIGLDAGTEIAPLSGRDSFWRRYIEVHWNGRRRQ